MGPGVSEMTKDRRRPRRGMYILPSLFTAGNIAAGYYAITQSLQGSAAQPQYFDHAALAIGFAIPFDAIDGLVARSTNTSSDFGRELDSLADVITFGVAPSILAYLWGFRALPLVGNLLFRQKTIELGIFICFLFLICGASRLARFNVSVNPQPANPGRPGRKYFVGMPIPAAAGVIASVVHCFDGQPVDSTWVSLVWLGLVSLVGFLMVSRWRFWSGKEIDFGEGRIFRLLVLLVLVGAAIALYSEYVLISIALGYLVSGLLARLAYSWNRGRNAAV